MDSRYIKWFKKKMYYIILIFSWISCFEWSKATDNFYQILYSYLPAITIILPSTERQVYERQPYHRCIGLRFYIPNTASSSIIDRKVIKVIIRTVGIFIAEEVVAIVCKVSSTYYEKKLQITKENTFNIDCRRKNVIQCTEKVWNC